MASTSTGRPPWTRAARIVALCCCLACPSIAPAAGPGAAAGKLVPAQGLVAYLEFDGLDAHAEAWKATAARAMLEGTPAGPMIDELARQLADGALKLLPGAKLEGADLVGFRGDLVRSGFAVGVYREAEGGPCLTLAIPGLGRAGPRERFERLARFCLDPSANAELPAPTRLRGRELRQIVAADRPRLAVGLMPAPIGDEAPKAAVPAGPWLSWWFEGDDLVLVSGPAGDAKGHDGRVGAVLDAIERKGLDASTHPGYLAALGEGGDLPRFEPDGLFFAEPGALQGLIAVLGGAGGIAPPGPLEGLELPSGRYMADDVKYFKPGPAEAIDQVPEPPAIPTPRPAKVDPASYLPTPRPAKVDPAPAPARVDPAPAPARVANVEPEPSKPAPARVDDAQPKVPKLAPAPEPAEAPKPVEPIAPPDDPFGLAGVGRVLGRWGFEGKVLVSDVRVEASRPRRGALVALDRPTFRKDQLPPIPKRAGSFAVGTFEPLKLADRAEALADLFDLAEVKAQVVAGLHDYFGLKLREDVLARLGTTWALCSIAPPTRPGDASGEAGSSDLALLASLADAEGFAKVLDDAAARFNAKVRELDGPPGGGGDDAPILALEALPASGRGYQLTSPAGLVAWLGDRLRPTIRVGRGFVALALDPETARDALAGELDPEARWRPTGELARAFEGLPETLALLCVGDPAGGSWTTTIPSLPVVAQTVAGQLGALQGGPEDVLGLFGVPKAGGFRVRIAPAKVPKWDDLRAHLFPSLLAASVDDRGVRVVAREAFPLAPLGDESSLDSSISWSKSGGVKKEFKFKVKKRLGR